MPAVIPFIPLIAAGVSGGAAIAGAKMSSNASNRASRTQADAATQALEFETRQYDEEQARLKPYRDMGSQAYARMARMLGLEVPPGAADAPPGPGGAPPGPWTPPGQPGQGGPPNTFSFASGGQPSRPIAKPMGGVTAGSGSPGGGPAIGTRRTFQNGRMGEWDGRGWRAVA